MNTKHKLKSAEELSKHFCYTCGIDPKYPENLNAFLPLIKEFQQNAIDEGRILGMKEAAELVYESFDGSSADRIKAEETILAAVTKLEGVE